MEAETKETQPQTAELSNDAIRLSVQRKPSCRVEYLAFASPALVQEAHRKAVKVVAKDVSLPGFRKGKAPDQMIIKNYPGAIDKQWQESIADLAFRECDRLAHVPLLNNESKITFNLKTYSLDNGAELSLSFETEPHVPHIDPKHIHIKGEKRPEVNEEKVGETIRQVRLFFAEWVPVTDRSVKEGDFIILDVDLIEEIPASQLFANTRFEVVEKSMAKWMRDLVIGQPNGASVEGVSVPDETASQEDKEALKPKKVRVTIRAIEEAIMPPLDDEFAQKLGVDNLHELHRSVSHLLHRQADGHVREALRERMGEYILSHIIFDLPASLIEREAQYRMRQLMGDSAFQKHWRSLGAEEQKKTAQSIFTQSEKAVRMFYVCRKIMHEAQISVTPRDLPKPATTPLEALIVPQPAHQQHEHTDMRQAEVVSRLMLEKAEDFLIDHANIEISA